MLFAAEISCGNEYPRLQILCAAYQKCFVICQWPVTFLRSRSW